MVGKPQLIEVDEETAALLRARAASRGISVPELLAEYLHDDAVVVATEAHQLAELDRRWAGFKEAGAAAAHDDVVRWLDTWGKPTFKPWRDR